MNWSEMRVAVRDQMSRDPQRGTLNTRAAEAVEQGLRHLESQGFQFEIAPKGTLSELVQLQEIAPTRTLSVAEAIDLVQPTVRPGNELSQFEARTKPSNVTVN